MVTTPAGAAVAYSAAEVNYLYDLQQGLLAGGVAAPGNAAIRATLAADRGLGVLLPGDRVTVVGHSLGGHLVQAFTQMFPMSVEQAYTFNAPGFGGAFAQLANSVLAPSGRLDITTSLVTNLFAEHGPDVTAGLGIMVGGTQRVFNEQSPIPIDDHFIEKLTDSLALYDLFQRIDPNAALANITDMLDASSNVSSRSLETALDGLRNLLAAPGSVPATAIGDRTSFNERVLALQPQIAQLVPGGALHVESLARLPAGVLAERALSEGGATYRYALDRLVPYAITGLDYSSRVTDHSLDLADEPGAPGMGSEWIQDRSQLLSWLSVRNFLDAGSAVRRTDGGSALDFSWMPASGARETLRVVVNAAAPPSQVSQIFFGGAAADTFSGSGRDDHLYGSGGDDVLQGAGGNDYLEGGAGNDQLVGGDGADTLVGGPGDDVLDGGAGENRLVGGAGFDRYLVEAGGVPSIIEDSDGVGAIISDGTQLSGGSGDEGLFWDESHSIYYTFSGDPSQGGMLGVNGQAVVLDFHNGDLGIQLAASDTEVPQPPKPAVTRHYFDSEISAEESALSASQQNPQYLLRYPWGSPDNDVYQPGSLLGPYFAGGAGDDVINGGFGYARLYGGKGNDVITGGARGDTAERALGDEFPPLHLLVGGAGQDQLTGSGEDDVLYGDFSSVRFSNAPNSFDEAVFSIDGREWKLPLNGSPGHYGYIAPGNFPELADLSYDSKVFVPAFGRDPALFVHDEVGNPSQEELVHYYDDQLRGNAGNDFLIGGPGNDDLYGGAGDDVLWGDNPPLNQINAAPGWGGMEFTAAPQFAALFGESGDPGLSGGDDFLDGGEGNDVIHDSGGTHSCVLGQGGNDTISVQLGGNFYEPGGPRTGYAFIDGGDGDDRIAVVSPQADIEGGSGVDSIQFTGLSAAISGGEGNDTISPSGLFVEMDGGPGSDTFAISRYNAYTYFGVGSYVVLNGGAAQSDFDTLRLPFSSDDYEVTTEGNDLVFELDPLLANPAMIEPDAAVLNVTVADWFAGAQYRMDRIAFPDSGEVWSAQDAEQALAGSALVFLDGALADDLAFDPGEPQSAEEQLQESLPPIEPADPAPSAEPPQVAAGPDDGGDAGSETGAQASPVASASEGEAVAAALPAPDAAPLPGSAGHGDAASQPAQPAASAPVAPVEEPLMVFSGGDVAPPSAVKGPRRTEETSMEGEGVAAPPEVVQLAASFFLRVEPPPLTTHQWLDQWFPAGSRITMTQSTSEDLPEQSTVTAPDDPGMDWELSPEEVRMRYEQIDAYLAQETEAGDLLASAPYPSAFFEWGSGLFMAGELRFGATPGLPQIATPSLRPLQGIAEGFAKLA